MTISVYVAKRSRKAHRCDECTKVINKGEPNVSLFGYAEEGDKPYTIYTHIKCASGSDDKVLNALEKARY